jgi:periplasmic copper chaperone A
MSRLTVSAATAALLVTTSAAFAHVELEADKAPAASHYKAVLMVPHGCAGSPTVGLRVQIPEGVIKAKPMPKAGWKLTTLVKKLDEPVDYYGTKLTEDVREIEWSGGELPDDFYDEFVFVALLPDKPGAVLHFPAIQKCATGERRWIEIPAEGKTAEDYKDPAPALTLGPKEAGGD